MQPFRQIRRIPAAIAAGIVLVALALLILAPRLRPDDVSAVADIPPLAGAEGQVAALVGGEPIYVYDIVREAVAQGVGGQGARLAPGEEAYDRVLNELIDQKLLAQAAAARRLDATPEARRRLETARERILGNVLLEAEVGRVVTDEAIRRMYDEQVRLVEMGDEVRARHILVESRQEAAALRQRILGGEDFVALAFAYSLDEPTRLEGGDLGYVTADVLPGPLATAAYATPVGSVSAPVESNLGWHIVQVLDRRASERPGFEALRPRVVRFMTFDAIQTLLARLRAGAQIEILTPDLPETGAAASGPIADFLNPGPANPAANLPDDLDGLDPASDPLPDAPSSGAASPAPGPIQ